MKEFVINSLKLLSRAHQYIMHDTINIQVKRKTLVHNNLTNPHEVNNKSENENIQHTT